MRFHSLWIPSVSRAVELRRYNSHQIRRLAEIDGLRWRLDVNAESRGDGQFNLEALAALDVARCAQVRATVALQYTVNY